MRRWTIVSLALGLTLGTGCLNYDDDSFFDPTTTFGPAPRPLEGVVLAADTPPPLAGGTLVAAADRPIVLASDPDRDMIWVVNTTDGQIVGQVALRTGDEPGRIVEDGQGGFLAVLRGAGDIVRIDGNTFDVDYRRPVCAAPRGIDYEAARDAVHVACEGGELIAFPVDNGPSIRETLLERDLRDVVVSDGRLYVSRFRSAEVLVLDDQGVEVARHEPRPSSGMLPAVAWRMVEHPDGGVLVVHQQAQDGSAPVPTAPSGGYYGDGDCGTAIVMGGVTHIEQGRSVRSSPPLFGLVLPVDVAISQHNETIAFVAAGNRNDDATSAAAVALTTPEVETNRLSVTCSAADGFGFADGRQVVAAVFDSENRLVVQSRDPWEVVVGESTHVSLPGTDRKDSGHDLFHEDTGAGIACASCHAEGGDDGVTWTFDLGPRRTQDMRGGLLGSEPFHWSGDISDFNELTTEVFSGRMAGPELTGAHVDALAGWIDRLPAPARAAPRDVHAAERGQELFESTRTGCVDCHSGPRYTDNRTVDVGTGEPFQVPALLGIGLRAPYMHDGCAPTLHARFTTTSSCGGGDAHGVTSELSDIEITDLVTYLETL